MKNFGWLKNSIFASGVLAAAWGIAAASFQAHAQMRWQESGGGSNYVGFSAPASVSTNTVWTLPAADGGANQCLVTDGSGTLSWATAGGGSTSFPLLASPVGSAGAPAYSFTGTDSDNGMFSPAADTVALSTAGTGRLIIDSTGKVGIGTTSPSGLLDVSAVDSGTTLNVVNRSSTSPHWPTIFITNYTGTETSGHSILSLQGAGGSLGAQTPFDGPRLIGSVSFEGAMNSSSFAQGASISAYSQEDFTGSSAPTDLVLATTPSGSIDAVERMRILANGKVGIGTTDPIAKLDVAGEVKFGNTSSTCNLTNEGQQRYNSSSKKMEFCNATAWTEIGGGGGASVPAGAIMAFSQATCPTGWLAANGAAISRATYADLFSAVATMYGVGNGSTTFNLPDYRGYFLRGWNNSSGNDPDAAGRTDRGDGTTGDNVGTKQTSEIASHTHSYNARFSNSGTRYLTNSTYGYEKAASLAQESGAVGGNETRPKNINVLYCIKQ